MEIRAEVLHEILWGPWTMGLFLGAGLVFTLRSGFFQLRGMGRWWRETAGSLGGRTEEKATGSLGGRPEAEAAGSLGGRPEGKAVGGPGSRPEGKAAGRRGQAVTGFQSACTALAATVGTGNIAGVATALTAGGPGAVFWMWVSGAIGMMTAYGETWLGQRYRHRTETGAWLCGPMVYMERGLGCPTLGMLYAAFALLASLGMGSMVQSNAIAGTLSLEGGLPSFPSAVLVTGLTALVILGGTRRIARAAERLMPVSAGIYILFSLLVILSCRERLPAVFAGIFRDAFHFRSIGGGTAGFLVNRSLRYGLSRGVFSNEAGLGSLAVLHGAAEDTTPERQGMWAMFGVFLDTIVICTMTALVVLCVEEETGGLAGRGLEGAALAARCFSLRLGPGGELLVAASMAVFAFATIIAWYYLGRQMLQYLLEKRFQLGHRGFCCGLGEAAYTFVYLAAVAWGCFGRPDVVWMISDLWNALMAYPNLLALFLLGSQVTYPEA